MDPQAIGRNLIVLAAEAEPIEIEVQDFPLSELDERLLAKELLPLQRPLVAAEQMVGALQEALDHVGWAPEIYYPERTERGDWAFGTAMIIRGAPRDIHRGFLQPVRRVPILTSIPERVALYLITIDDGEDYLDREAHSGVGWHYHYLDSRKLRSDAILCWDTRWNAPHPQRKPPARRGLFVEKHAEKGKAFKAKPWKWGSKKRETMYDVCSADLQKRQIAEYRCAANKSNLVYPPGATLTPRPAPAPRT